MIKKGIVWLERYFVFYIIYSLHMHYFCQLKALCKLYNQIMCLYHFIRC